MREIAALRDLLGEEDADIGPHTLQTLLGELHEGMERILIVPEGVCSYRAFVWYARNASGRISGDNRR